MQNMSSESPSEDVIKKAREVLDAHVVETVKWHFSEGTGCPFWLDWKKKSGWDPVQEVKGFDDLLRFDNFDGDVHLRVTHHPKPGRAPDQDNAIASFKAYQDGLADALGVDDSRFYLNLARFNGDLRDDGTALGEWTCGPFDLDVGGYVDTQQTVRGSWQLSPIVNPETTAVN